MRLIFLGDVMLGRLVNRHLATVPPEHVWGDVLPVLRGADAVFLNLECVIADQGLPQPGKAFTFRSDAKNVAALEAARVTAVSLANNHSLDYGPAALEECLGILRARGIAYAGAGRTIDEARAPAVISAAGRSVAFVSCTDNEPSWEAGRREPGIFYAEPDPHAPRFAALRDVVRHCADAAHLVVVSAHWGPNWGRQPPPEHVDAARLLIDAGAAVVFGHSAHITRGIELYGGRPILYSCGDFVDDYQVDEVERNDLSFMFILEYEQDQLSRVLLRPTVIEWFQARLANGADRRLIEDRMRDLCEPLGTAAGGTAEGLEIPVR